MCVTIKPIDEKLTSENLFKVITKNKRSKKTPPDSLVFAERPWANCHTIKNKIKRTTSCSNLPIKARETAKRAASCAFTITSEQAMVPLKWAE